MKLRITAAALVAASFMPNLAQATNLSEVYESVQVREDAGGVSHAYYNGQRVAWQDYNGNNAVDEGELGVNFGAQAQTMPCTDDCPAAAELDNIELYFGETETVAPAPEPSYETVEVVENVTTIVTPPAKTITQNVTTIVKPMIPKSDS